MFKECEAQGRDIMHHLINTFALHILWSHVSLALIHINVTTNVSLKKEETIRRGGTSEVQW